jgi:hypothetical protein
MTFVVTGSWELLSRGAIRMAKDEKSNSSNSAALLQSQPGILSRKRKDDLRISLYFYRKSGDA